MESDPETFFSFDLGENVPVEPGTLKTFARFTYV